MRIIIFFLNLLGTQNLMQKSDKITQQIRSI